MTGTVLELDVDDVERALPVLETTPGVREAYLSGALLHANITGIEASAVVEALKAGGLDVHAVHAVDPTIEDVFVHLVTSRQKSVAADA